MLVLVVLLRTKLQEVFVLRIQMCCCNSSWFRIVYAGVQHLMYYSMYSWQGQIALYDSGIP